MSSLNWVTVRLTNVNREEMDNLVIPYSASTTYVAVSYIVSKKYYFMAEYIGEPSIDLVINSFELLPQILLMIDLGMSTKDIRNSLNLPYNKDDYECLCLVLD